MEQIYHWIGLVVFWLSAGIGTLLLVGYIGKLILDELGKRFKMLWKIVEFAYYYADYKEWIKDKKRHPKCE